MRNFRVEIRTPGDWSRLIGGMVAVFALFHWSALALGSDRGQAGIVVGAIVTAAILAVERLWFARTLADAALAIGFGPPDRSGLLASAVISALLLAVVPLYAAATGSHVTMIEQWWMQLPGLFAQAGIAEEALFRGYLFGHLRRGRSFWRAASTSMLPFAAVHLLMFFTMPWPVAAASLLLALVISFPMAQGNHQVDSHGRRLRGNVPAAVDRGVRGRSAADAARPASDEHRGSYLSPCEQLLFAIPSPGVRSYESSLCSGCSDVGDRVAAGRGTIE